jgi:RNA polymerase sigma-70 factor (ECF subfamily)
MPPTISHDSSTSHTLLERVKLRQPEAWRRLVELYGPIVYRWCRRYRLFPDDAADIVQEVFANVARHVDRFEHRTQHGGFRSWLSTITHNEVCDFLRREQRQAQGRGGTDAQEHLAQIPEPPEPSDLTDLNEDRQLISRRALELVRVEFENRTWEAFQRAVLEGQYPADIAADLGISVNAVYKAKSRVLRRLRQELDELLD